MLDPFSQPMEFSRMIHSRTLEQERQANQAAALAYVHEMRPLWCGVDLGGTSQSVEMCAGCGKGKGRRK